MPTGSTIVSVSARQIFSDRGHPGVEATVTTQNGSRGTAVVTAGVSVGVHEQDFLYALGIANKGLQKRITRRCEIGAREIREIAGTYSLGRRHESAIRRDDPNRCD